MPFFSDSNDRLNKEHRSIRAIAAGAAMFCVIVSAAAILFWPRNEQMPNTLEDSNSDAVFNRSTKVDSQNGSSEPNESVEVVATSFLTRQQELDMLIDPAHDSWNSEILASSAETELKALSKRLQEDVNRRISPSHDNSLEDVVVHLPGREWQTSFDQSGVTVQQLTGIGEHVRYSTLIERLHAWLNPSQLASVAVKTTNVTSDGSEFITTSHRVDLTAVAQSQTGKPVQTVEQHWIWNCRWKRKGDELLLHEIFAVSGYQLVSNRSAASSPHWFTDETFEVLTEQAVATYRDQLQPGLNHWLRRIPSSYGMYLFAEYGLAVGDLNGDGTDDLYVCQPGGLPNRLFLSTEEGSFHEAAATAQVDWLDHSSSALIVDLDNDGDQDLAIALGSHRVVVMENTGMARFRVAAELTIEDRHVQGLSAVDFDNDRFLDLYLTVGFADESARSAEERPRFVYDDANEGGANVLFRNAFRSQPWRFLDVTRSTGLDAHNRRHSLAAAWEDFDNDGDQDLYVANDYGRNCLYRNDAGHFTEVARLSGTEDAASGMSVSWSDVDLDGNFDLYVGNMFSTAGLRIVPQDRFRELVGDPHKLPILRRFAKGNTLFRNRGDGSFQDISHSARAEMGRWSWSSLFTDVNLDGYDDLLVANGYITNGRTTDL